MYATQLELQIGFGILIVLLIASIVLLVLGGIKTTSSVNTRNKYAENNRRWLIEGTLCPPGYRRIPNTDTIDINTGLNKYMCELINYKEPDTNYMMLLAGSVLTGVFISAIGVFTYLYNDRLWGDIDIGELNNCYIRKVNELEKTRSDLGRLYQTYGNNLDQNVRDPTVDIDQSNKIFTAVDIQNKASSLRDQLNKQIDDLNNFAETYHIEIHDPKKYVSTKEFTTPDIENIS